MRDIIREKVKGCERNMTIDELENRLNNEFPNVYKCILISGDWGIGKTYFLKNVFLKEREYIYISLFGSSNIEAIKTEIYSKLNKKCNMIGKIKKVLYRADGNNIGLGPISLPITYWETDINEAIGKNIRDKVLTVVIDDIERKSKEINIEDILGTIETLSEIDNINVILVANENKIEEYDKNKFLNFKEKIIQKTYNIHKYSKDTPKEITKHLLKDVKLQNNIDVSIISKNIIEVFENHPVNNLRTLEKGVNFVNLILRYIDFQELDSSEIKDIIIAALSVVIETIEGTYINKENKQKDESLVERIINDSGNKLISCIIKNYFKEQYFISKKSTIVNLLLDIYQDKDVQVNFEKLNKYYKDLHTIDETKEEIDLFYMSEEQLEEKIDNFYNNYILKADKTLDINNWFKKLNEIYTYAKAIGKEKKFKDEDILKAMDIYLENLQVNEGLFYILDRHIPHQISEDKMLEYNKQLNEKITEKYYAKSIENIVKKIEENDFNAENLDRLYTIYTEDHIKFDKQKIINIMEDNKYFIPNLNYEISDKIWSWAHSIWEKERSYKQYRDNGFEKCVKGLLQNSTAIGKYRIESLNRQYGINIDDVK